MDDPGGVNRQPSPFSRFEGHDAMTSRAVMNDSSRVDRAPAAWPGGARPRSGAARPSRLGLRRADRAGPLTALFLAETADHMNDGASFLEKLSASELTTIRQHGMPRSVAAQAPVFRQGEPHHGIFLIESGLVRTYYTGPSGREITLAYWTPGHFVGGPELYGGGAHVWSADAFEDSALLFLTGPAIRGLIEQLPRFALCLIDGLVAKGKCYSALAQMLGTRSVVGRLAQLLVIMGEVYGKNEGNRLVVQRRITYDQLATIVGATRQWVTMTLDRFERLGIISLDRKSIAIERPDLLLEHIDN
jgi:CRP-like cAMP-binding protein